MKRHRQGEYRRVPLEQQTDTWIGKAALSLGLRLHVKPTNVNKGIDFSDTQSPDAPYWCGVIVGHWLVGPTHTVDKRTKHICVSRCGIAENYEAWEIAAGRLPATCYGCRPGNHRAPSHRTLPEQAVRELAAFWEEVHMAVAFEERSNLRGKEANSAWYDLARPLMARVVNSTGYGQHFGWKIFVQTCATKSYKMHASQDFIRVRAVHKATRHIEIVLQPAGSHYEFEIDLSTGRTDHEFMEVAEKVKAVVEDICPKEEKKPQPTHEDKKLAAAADPSENGNGKVVNVEALKKIQGNLGKLIQVAGDMNEMAGMKHVAQEKLRQASERARESYIRLVAAQEDRDKAKRMADAHSSRVKELEDKLRIEMQLRDAADEVLRTKSVTVADAEREYGPLTESAEAAKKELADLEKLEAENLKSVGDAKNLELLLAALSKMG